MNKVSLKSISSSISSGLTPLRSNESYWNNGVIPWVKTEQLGKKNIYNSNEKISKKAFDETSIKLNPKNTISVAMYGAGRTRGSVAILKNEMTTNQACCNLVINESKAHYEYVYYCLKAHYGNLRKRSSGVRKNLNTSDIKNFEILLPSLNKQKKIAEVLSDLDKKIELNKKINEELEAVAKLIYDYWFVQFDFPDEDGKPYKSSDGKMIFIEELNRKIPEGWGVKELGEYAEIKKGDLITAKTANGYGNIKVVSAGLDFSYYHSEANRKENTITVSASGANAGFVNFWREPIFACDCTTVRGKSVAETLILKEFLEVRQEYLFGQAKGSAQPHVYPKDIEALKIALPKNGLVEEFGKIVLNANKLISNNLKENKDLVELRDWLLPMLMNGQVTVAEPQQEISAAAKLEGDYKPAKKPTNVDYYKRTVLAAEIVWQLHKQPTLGHLKLQKLIYLAQQSSDMKIPTNFLRQAAGPYDPQMARSIDKQLKKKKWFAYNEDEFFNYKPLENAGEHREDFDKYFSGEKESIQYLINTLKKAKSSSVEIVATLYACWKEIQVNNEAFSEELLIEKFYNWSKEKAKYEEERLKKAIGWMRDVGIVPDQKLEMSS